MLQLHRKVEINTIERTVRMWLGWWLLPVDQCCRWMDTASIVTANWLRLLCAEPQFCGGYCRERWFGYTVATTAGASFLHPRIATVNDKALTPLCLPTSSQWRADRTPKANNRDRKTDTPESKAVLGSEVGWPELVQRASTGKFGAV